MKIAIDVFALLAMAAWVVAYQLPVAEIPVVGLVKLSETTWSGGGRQYFGIACVLLATVLRIGFRIRTLPAILTAIALGLWIDLTISGWQFREDQLGQLASMNALGLETSIVWKPGLWAFGLLGWFLLILTILVSWPPSQSKAGGR